MFARRGGLTLQLQKVRTGTDHMSMAVVCVLEPNSSSGARYLHRNENSCHDNGLRPVTHMGRVMRCVTVSGLAFHG